MTEQLKNSFLQSLLPSPKHIDFCDGDFFRLENGAVLILSGPAVLQQEIEKVVRQLSAIFWNIDWVIQFQVSNQDFPTEGYAISITSDSVSISAASISGIRYAFMTLRQMAQTERGVTLFSCYLLPQCKIEDAPALPFRGLHLCWFPETTACDIEKALRLAAYLKYNAVVLESWGVFPFECTPDFCWPDKKVPRDVFAHLVEIAKQLGIELIPQINITGHAAWSRGYSGKHAILDFSPKYDSLFEPDGWCWCLSNPETRKLLSNMICELHDAFGCPTHFHIGCDEAHTLGTCCECAKHNTAKLFKEHLIYFHDLLLSRNARTMLWHDMLLDKEDPAYQGFMRFGRKDFANMIDELPKDLLICDWQYCIAHHNSPMDFEWKSSSFFHEHGFDTLLCPWDDPQNAKSQAAYMARNPIHGKGILATTWHWFWGERFTAMIGVPAQANWNPQDEVRTTCMPCFVRQICHDMGIASYEEFGYNNDYQVAPEAYPQG